MEDEETLLIELARLIWNNGISVADLYRILGIDLDDIQHSDPDLVVARLAGIITGWQTSPTKE